MTATALPTIPLGPELTIAFAAAARETLADALFAAHGDCVLDLGNVTDFDSAGVQLLLAARRTQAAAGRTLRIGAASPAVADALALLGLQDLLE